ncbi:MAG: hypothetical protein CM15mP55_1440 [Hyphomicrobiales bacterium]|nr:MAG: hypothetical protein CM15mP55_1440 [Hyphomicrobiales bacterium]
MGHVERCTALLHLVDATQDDIVADYRTIRHELAAYSTDLAGRREVIALTKCDALDRKFAQRKTTSTGKRDGHRAGSHFCRKRQNIDQLCDILLNCVRSGEAETPAKAAGSAMQQSAGWHPLERG